MDETIVNPDREEFTFTDALDLHFAVIEGVKGFVDEYKSPDGEALTNALYYSFQILKETFVMEHSEEGTELLE